MRKINKIVVHHAVTKRTPIDLRTLQPEMNKMITVKNVRQWHLARGWRDVGYHYFIRQDGVIEVGRPLHQRGAHVRGHNKDSIGICLAGGLSDDEQPVNNYTTQQMESLGKLLDDLILLFPGATILGHKDLDKKKPYCPMIDVQDI